MKSLVTCLLITISIIAVSQDNMVIDQKTGKISYDKIGNVKFLKGKVFRTKKMEKASEEIGVNFPILEKDIIQTGEKSVIKIIMNDATIITLGENSHFNFKNYKMKSKSERVATYDLKSGNARIDVPVKISKGKLNFNTRTVSLGVRGTKFLMKQEVETNGDLKEQIALLEGQVEIENKNGTKTIMNPGDHYLLKKQASNEQVFDKVVKMDSKFLKYLKAEEVSDDTIKPFLAKMDNKVLSDEDADSSESINQGKSSSQKKSGKLPKAKHFWKDSLQKLNNKLKNQND